MPPLGSFLRTAMSPVSKALSRPGVMQALKPRSNLSKLRMPVQPRAAVQPQMPGQPRISQPPVSAASPGQTMMGRLGGLARQPVRAYRSAIGLDPRAGTVDTLAGTTRFMAGLPADGRRFARSPMSAVVKYLANPNIPGLHRPVGSGPSNRILDRTRQTLGNTLQLANLGASGLGIAAAAGRVASLPSRMTDYGVFPSLAYASASNTEGTSKYVHNRDGLLTPLQRARMRMTAASIPMAAGALAHSVGLQHDPTGLSDLAMEAGVRQLRDDHKASRQTHPRRVAATNTLGMLSPLGIGRSLASQWFANAPGSSAEAYGDMLDRHLPSMARAAADPAYLQQSPVHYLTDAAQQVAAELPSSVPSRKTSLSGNTYDRAQRTAVSGGNHALDQTLDEAEWQMRHHVNADALNWLRRKMRERVGQQFPGVDTGDPLPSLEDLIRQMGIKPTVINIPIAK